MPFAEPFMQAALIEVLLLAVIAGALGSWIVLRRLAFYTHAVGTATFPGLVLADAWAVNMQVLALASGAGFGGAVRAVGARGRAGAEAATGLALVLALATGVVLASDVFAAGAGVDRLLFGSLLGVSGSDLGLTALVAAAALVANAVQRRTWLATGFDPGAARALGVPAAWGDRILLGLIAAAVVVALDAVGALLVLAALVVPAATVRLVTRRVATLQWGTAALAALEGTAALWVSYALDVGPGAALAVLSAAVFAAVAAVSR